MDGSALQDQTVKKLSHKQYKAHLRKEKRRTQRQAAAKLQEEQELKDATPHQELSAEEAVRLVETEQQQDRQEEQERTLAHLAWLEREREAQHVFEQQRKKEEARKQKLLEEQQRIQQEWEATQEKECQSQSKKERELEDILQQLDKEIASGEDRPTHNPEAPRHHVPEAKRDSCPFFLKTGGCRFGDRCSRAHPQPAISTVLLLPHMYSDFTLEQSHRDEYDTDMCLEYDEGDAYERFLEFYQDVLPEFKEVGTVVQFKVCCNWEPHLRGNVYVQYKKEEDSSKARESFHGRYYAGKLISCIYTPVTSWKAAICGMFHQNKCSRGKNCNFLHVFNNPKREFSEADRDFQLQNNRGGQSQRGWWHERDRNRRSRSRSRERHRDQRRRSRSRSRDRRHQSVEQSRRRYSSRRRRSRSRSRTRRNRSRTRSRSRSRSPRRSRRHRSRSGSRSRRGPSQSPSRKRSASQSHQHKSRSRSRSRSPNHLRRSRSKSPRLSARSSKKHRRIRESRDYKQASSGSDDDIHMRTTISPSSKKKCKSHKDRYSLQSPDCSNGESSSIDEHEDESNGSTAENSGLKKGNHQATDGGKVDNGAIKPQNIDPAKVKDEPKYERSFKTRHLCTDSDSTAKDSEGSTKDGDDLRETRYSRSLGAEKLKKNSRQKRKKKHKKSHKKHKKSSSPSPVIDTNH